MDVVNFPGIIAQHGLLDAAEVSLQNDLLLIGKKVNGYRDGSQYEELAITIQEFATLVAGGAETLAQTLALGNVTGGNNIIVSDGDGVTFNSGAFSGTIAPSVLAGNVTWSLPTVSGTIALVSDIITIYNSDGIIGSGRVATITDTLTFTGGKILIQDGTEGVPGYIWTSIDANGTGSWIPSPTASTNIYNADGTITDAVRTVTINTALQFVQGTVSMGGTALAGDRLRIVAGAGLDGGINISAFNLANNGYGVLVQGGSSGATYSGVFSDANGGSTGANRGGFFGAGVSGPQENYGIYASARNGSVYSVGVYADATGGDSVNPSEFAAGLWANVEAILADDRRAINATIVEASTVNNSVSYGMKFETTYVSVVANETIYGVHAQSGANGAGVINTAIYLAATGTGGSTNYALVTDGGNLGFGTISPNSQSMTHIVPGARAHLLLDPITAVVASAIAPTNGMQVHVSTTNGTFTSVGLWSYEGGAWVKM